MLLSGPQETSVGISAQALDLDWQKTSSMHGVPLCSFPQFPPDPQDSCSPSPEQGCGEKQALHWALCPQRGKGLQRNRFTAPPKPAARASLGTKQSLLSNFKCYLRTAWPQPKAALWKLVFRCRGCKYQRHTFGGVGVASMPLPPPWQGLALNGHSDTWSRHTQASADRGTFTPPSGLCIRDSRGVAVEHSTRDVRTAYPR